MMNKKNQLSIRLYGEPVGVLTQTPSGKKSFVYLRTAINAISVGMPIREEAYDDLHCEAFFAGLLPESESAKKIIGKRFGISPNNSFALLRAIGYDCAGAISCHTMDEPVNAVQAVPLTGKVISDEDLYKHIIELPKNPLFIDVEGLRLSLAGVQDKAAICLINNQIALPENGCPTTHILKPASPYFEGLVENEYFILKLAKRIGLPVAEVELKKIHDISFLLIERYDRQIKNNLIKRIHQEDFCQALGIPSFKKYQNEGGPGFSACFALLDKTTQPAIDRNALASAVVFNYLIGNMDAHGKNFSLLHYANNQIRLAPFYDLVCTRAYEKLSSKMAMKIGSKYGSDQILPRHWQSLCTQIQYRYIAMVQLLQSMGEQLKLAAELEKIQMNENGIDHPIIDKIITSLNRTIDKTLVQFSKN